MKSKSDLADDHISKIFSDPEKVRQAIQKGINKALLQHKLAGNPVCEWKNNRVVWIAAKDIKIPKD